ncbi:MAG: hypothetical protein K9L30_16020 [Desulfobacterales bacterium]|nr:hypothetical protein [Desulfobacterales bacterium]
MKIRSLFIMVIILLCVFGGVLGVSIYSSLKLQAFQATLTKAGELPFSWSQFQGSTKELLITYEMGKAQRQWLTSYKLFTDRFNSFMDDSFTRNLINKNIDFNISVARVMVHWNVIQKNLKLASLQLRSYHQKNFQLDENQVDSGNVLVNFGQNWAVSQYNEALINVIAHLRKNTSRSDYLFSSELDGIRKHVEMEIQDQTRHIRFMSIISSTLIFGIAGIFILYHFVGLARSKEASQRYADDLSSEILERIKTEKMLRSERSKLETVLDAMGEGMYIVNSDYRIEHQNAFLENVYGKDLSPFCHKKYNRSDDPCQYCHIQDVIRSRERRQVEVALDDGKNYHLIFSPFADVDGKMKAIVLWYDITEEKKNEAEVLRAAHLASVGELAAGVAHEVNNPINGIISIAEIIQTRFKDKADINELAGRLIREGDRVSKIVRNLLSFSKNRFGKHHPCKIEDILSDAMGLMEHQLLKDGIHISVKIPSDLPIINVQTHEIQQVFINIMSNARYALNKKYSKRSENKLLDISAAIHEDNAGRFLRMIFYDQGTGIKKEIRDLICNPFFSTKSRNQGTGLGLSISKGIMENHKGRMMFESVYEEYTKVLLDFPLPAQRLFKDIQ